MRKDYYKAPLPFMGQKKRFLKKFKEVLQRYPKNAIYVDLFGGSGLLSHTVKQTHPDSIVIYNDFDNYTKRIESIYQTNKLLYEMRDLLDGVDRSVKLNKRQKAAVFDLVESYEHKYGFVDYVSLSASILFGGKYATNFKELKKSTLYNRIRKTGFDATGYLKGVDIEHKDYRDVYSKYKGCDDVIFIIDPPYLQTQSTTYKNYWGLKDYLDVLKILEGNKYIYFTSDKSSIIELCEWFETSTMNGNPFKQANRSTTHNSVNYQSSYTDIMLFK